MIEIRYMKPDQIARLRELDISEADDIIYKCIDGGIVAAPETWRRQRWSDEECSRRTRVMRDELTNGEIVVLGAFEGDNLVGLATFRAQLSPGMSEFAGLWVDRSHRRKGVATRLAQEVEGLAREAGSSALYVSASPSRSAVGFYRSRGFQPTLDVNQELYEREPEDIHMVLNLAWTAGCDEGAMGAPGDHPARGGAWRGSRPAASARSTARSA